MSEPLASLVDRVTIAMAVYPIDGSVPHLNDALRSLLTQSKTFALIERRMITLASELGALVRDQPRAVVRALVRESRTHSIHVAGLRLAGTLAFGAGRGAPAVVMVSVTKTGAAIDDASSFASGALALLSPREREVALLLAEGLSNKAAAARIGVTEHTARRHTERVLRRLGVTSRQMVAPLLLRRA